MKLKKLKNTIQTINTKNYRSDYWEYAKKKTLISYYFIFRCSNRRIPQL